MKFTELGLEEDILKAVLDNGYDEPTPIQAETIPDVLAGKDIIGQAQTGTGKRLRLDCQSYKMLT